MAWLSGWSYRHSITINSNGVGLSGNLTNFAIAVNIPSSATSFWADVKADGTDVRFTSADGTTLLKFEIESFDNTADDAWYHVKVPTLDAATDTVIYIYYGNSGATTGEDITNTWDSNFYGVYHLNQDKAAGAYDDSTVNGYDGTNGTTVDGTGQIDKCRIFDGDISDTTTIRGIGVHSVLPSDPTLFSLALWTKNVGIDLTASPRVIFAHRDESTRLIQITAQSNSSVRYQIRSSGNSLKYVEKTGLTMSNRNHFAITFDKSGNSFELYCNGVLAGTDTTNFGAGTFISAKNLIGQYYQGAAYGGTWGGEIDEVKVSSVVRTLDWVVAEYQSGLGTWIALGGQEVQASMTVSGVSTITMNPENPKRGSITVSGVSTVTMAPTGGTVVVTASMTVAAVSTVSMTPSARLSASMTVSGVSTVTMAPISLLPLHPYTVLGFPAGYSATVQYKVLDIAKGVVQDWTNTDVVETATGVTGYSVYDVIIRLERGFQGLILWKIPSTTYHAEEPIDLVPLALPTLLEMKAGGIALETTVQSNFTKLSFVEKWILNKLVESPSGDTITLYDDDGVTPLKSWAWNNSTKTRSRAT